MKSRDIHIHIYIYKYIKITVCVSVYINNIYIFNDKQYLLNCLSGNLFVMAAASQLMQVTLTPVLYVISQMSPDVLAAYVFIFV